ncbi:hypothetical protein CEUSTIGMA_g5790.t1 [Chlamydomonas eustigma]|uniref:PH domain-containing protein n=1 Tax=Chlamydomonas eustigma TaxID=1157962 RepID=A0A250X5L0_9CHLO|nr:hypothetical protein CEUSTIGMA_g5790.t1 [Chlamydomonas eustigma]|eukprot:GAX78348.1 hypothetical protein CEUSTIGMA_g5790.t1 [Chlamydomonas eustigma]
METLERASDVSLSPDTHNIMFSNEVSQKLSSPVPVRNGINHLKPDLMDHFQPSSSSSPGDASTIPLISDQLINKNLCGSSSSNPAQDTTTSYEDLRSPSCTSNQPFVSPEPSSPQMHASLYHRLGIPSRTSSPNINPIILRDSMASPPPPADPQLDQTTLKGLMHMLGPKIHTRRFHAEEITQNDELARAARKEMEPPEEWQLGGHHEHDLERMQGDVDSIVSDAAEESKVNKEVAELVVQQLKEGRKSLEGLLKVLQTMLSAETAYISAMQGASHLMNKASTTSAFSASLKPASSSRSGSRATSISGGNRLHRANSGEESVVGASRYERTTSGGGGLGRNITRSGSTIGAGQSVLDRGSFGGSLVGIPRVGGPNGGVRSILTHKTDTAGQYNAGSSIATSYPGTRGVDADVSTQCPDNGMLNQSEQRRRGSTEGGGCSAGEKQSPLHLSPSSSYSSALDQDTLPSAASHQASVPLPLPHSPSPVDQDPLHVLLDALAVLPGTIAAAHGQLQSALSSLFTDCGRLRDDFGEACSRAVMEGSRMQGEVEAGRRSVVKAYQQHVMVCRSFDEVLRSRAQGSALRGPEHDPWATEATLARQHQVLRLAQDAERGFLKRAFAHARVLESRRFELSKQAVAVVAGSYRAALLPVQHDLVSLLDSAHTVDTAAKLGKLSKAAATAEDIANKAAERHAQSVAGVCQELFCSQEIIRQGEMQYLDAPLSRWASGHFVLTRAGFLHWFRSIEEVQPLGTLHLSKCQLEAGTAFCFHVLESRATGWLGSTRSYRFSLHAPSVEDCCEWVVAIREAIAVASGKSLHYEDTHV